MEFHPEKYKVLTVTRMKDPVKHTYTLHGIELERVTSSKYLGLTLTNQLDLNAHINNIASKANKSLGFLNKSEMSGLRMCS